MTINCSKCGSTDLRNQEHLDEDGESIPIDYQTIEFADNKYQLCMNCCLDLRVWILGKENGDQIVEDF